MYSADTLPTSCAAWINIPQEQIYFSLEPGETKEIDIRISVPAAVTDSLVPVRTVMLFFTQMNPVDDMNSQGANIKVNVKSGVKLYVRPRLPRSTKIEITDLLFNRQSRNIELYIETKSNIWTDGTIYSDVLNTSDGKKIQLQDIVFYTLPGNKRKILAALPKNMTKGKYVASYIIDYGNENQVEAAELSFLYE